MHLTASLAEDDPTSPTGPEGHRPASDHDEIPPSGIISWLVGLSFLGVSTLKLTLVSNIVVVDLAIAMVILIAVMSARVRGSHAVTTLIRAAPWMWLILIGSVLGLWGVGLTSWAIDSLVRTIMAVGAFFAFWYVIDLRRVERPAIIGTAIGLVANVVAGLFFSTSNRARGLIGSANYLGHYAVLAGMLLLLTSRRTWVKLASVVLVALALWVSASFGSMAMLVAAAMVGLIRIAARNSAVLTAILITFAATALFFSLTSPQILESDGVETSAISQERFERSQASRFELWGQAWERFTDEPLGLGPNGVKHRNLAINSTGAAEIHSDGFGFLVERGVPGLIGLIGLWGTIWFASRPGGLARVFIVMLLVAGLFRETIHFRHGWLILALVFVLDDRAIEARSGTSDPGDVERTGPGSIPA